MHRIEGENVDVTTGVNLFKTTPPYTVITPELMNAIQEEIMYVISQAGMPLLNKSNDTRDQLWTAMSRTIQPYNYVVSSQATFNALFTRTAANTYKMASAYRSVYFKYVEGGYSVTPLLSGGDTWGDLYTNNASSVEFENGTYINFGSARGNITANTAGGYLRNVDIRGSGVVGAAVNSFYLQNNYVTFDNCKTSARNSNTNFHVFEGSGTALHNTTSKYVNCTVSQITGSSNFYGFYKCYNLSNCIVENISVNSGCYGFNLCYLLSNCISYNLTSAVSTVYGFLYCYLVNSCLADNMTSTANNASGFQNCEQISTCIAKNITGHSTAGDLGYGFSDCICITSCSATLIAGNVNEGFHSCTYGAALYTNEAANSGNDYIDTIASGGITNEQSCGNWWT